MSNNTLTGEDDEEENITFFSIPLSSANFSASPWSLPPNFSYSYSVLGDLITFRFYAFFHNLVAVSGITTDVIVPLAYRIDAELQQRILGPVAGVQTVIRIVVNTNGTFNVFPINGITFGVVGLMGWDTFEVSWRYGL